MLIHSGLIFYKRHRSMSKNDLSKRKILQILVVCAYVLTQVYLKQIPENNCLFLWQEFKNEFGIKLLLLDAQFEKNRNDWNKKTDKYSWTCHFVAAIIVEMLLIMSGDVELNPGPLQGDLVLEDLQEVFDIVYDVQSKWYSIGVELRIETSVLDAIKVEFNGVPEECLFQMLRHWLKQLPLPTMREMIQALGSEPIGEKHLSLSLRRKVYGEQYPTKGRLTITDLADVRSVLFSIRHRWYMLGSFLKISSGTLDSIKSQCKNDPSDCLLEMIKTWLSQNEPLPTWENLVHVLSSASICESELAAKICTKYCSEVLKQLSPVETNYPSAADIITRYSSYLKQMYRRFRLPLDSQWPPVRSESFVPISLSVIRGDGPKEYLKLGDIFSGNEQRPVSTVLIEGAPGIGKTATSLTICKDWTSGEHFKTFDILLFWSMKDPTLHSLKGLDDLFFHDSEDVSHSVASAVRRESGKGVLFVFDGWDELPPKVSHDRNFCLFDIIKGKRFPFASVVITSRPIESQHLLQTSMFDRHVEICGFSSEGIVQYIERCFVCTPDKAAKLVNSVTERPDIESICYVPMNCAIVSYVYSQLNKLPTTFTQFYSYLTLNGLLRNIQLRGSDEEMQITQLQGINDLPFNVRRLYMALCELAFRGLISGIHSFPRDKIVAVCQSTPKIIANVDNLGILQAVNVFHVTGVDSSFHFLHSTVQEFMAARYLASLGKKEQTYYVRNYLDYMSFEMVWQFYCGISAEEKSLFDSEIIKTFQRRMKELSWLDEEETAFENSASSKHCVEELVLKPSDTESARPEISDEERVVHGKPPLPPSLSLMPPSTALDSAPSTTLSISSSVSTSIGDVVGSTGPQDLGSLSGISRTLTGVTAELAYVVPSENVDTRRLLVILKCIYESQEPTLCQRIARSCQNQLNFHISLSAVDTNAIGYLIGKGSQQWKVSFVGCGLGVNEMKTLKHQITFHGKIGRIQALTLSDNPLDVTAIQQFMDMRQAFKNLQLLSLKSTQLNDESIKLLSPSLQSFHSLKSLNLADNEISSEGMAALSTALFKCANLSELNLSNNILSEVAMKHLAFVISSGCEFSELVLRGNSIGDEGVRILLSCMVEGYPLKHLDLSNNDITSEGAALVASALCSLLVHIETLALDSNSIGTEGAHLIFSALRCNSSIQKLALSACDIHFSVELVDAMKQCLLQAKDLWELEIECNFLGDEGISAICDVVQNEYSSIKHLGIASNEISPAVLMLLGPVLINSKLELLSITSSELSTDTEDFEIFLQFMQSSKCLRSLHIYEVGGEKEKLEVAFEYLNTNRFQQGLNDVFVKYHSD